MWLWYLSVTLLVVMTVFLFVRFVLFLSVWVCGYEFWLLPRLFDDTLSFTESFKPGYSWEKVPDEEGGTLIDFVVDETTGVEFVDVDGDGDDDIVVTTEDGKPSVVYENKDGRFPDPPTPIGDELYDAQDVEVVDINGDGIKDMRIALLVGLASQGGL